MSSGDAYHLQNLRAIHSKNLQDLEEKAAKFGELYVPPYIKSEIDDLKQKIAAIDAQLESLPAPDAVKPSVTSAEPVDPVELRPKLQKYFSLDELRTIAFDLGVDQDNFTGGKESVARELVLYFERRGRLDDLANHCRKLRPNVAW